MIVEFILGFLESLLFGASTTATFTGLLIYHMLFRQQGEFHRGPTALGFGLIVFGLMGLYMLFGL